SRHSSQATNPSSKISCSLFASVAPAAPTNSMSLCTTFSMSPIPKNSMTGMPMLALRLADLPADSLTCIEHDGHNLVVIRSGDRVFAYHDTCPHAFWPLSQGTLHSATIECPGHGWEFDIETGRCLNASSYCLTPVPLTVVENTVQIAPSPSTL